MGKSVFGRSRKQAAPALACTVSLADGSKHVEMKIYRTLAIVPLAFALVALPACDKKDDKKADDKKAEKKDEKKAEEKKADEPKPAEPAGEEPEDEPDAEEPE